MPTTLSLAEAVCIGAADAVETSVPNKEKIRAQLSAPRVSKRLVDLVVIAVPSLAIGFFMINLLWSNCHQIGNKISRLTSGLMTNSCALSVFYNLINDIEANSCVYIRH
ncbi:hypothetical protein GP2143_17381 [marine gamma proteobacterium HTCC2143]|jgi:hypothetical protein|uniref:Uncharacterized protein n=1 Tax=marine gamma proteobacterium HTCC2143 TaxID=247633 RepID=A0YA96_9GAMM|nr:hypothetical protein GP2143_17381 [marine gamma proteobacterium HTCC2143]